MGIAALDMWLEKGANGALNFQLPKMIELYTQSTIFKAASHLTGAEPMPKPVALRARQISLLPGENTAVADAEVLSELKSIVGSRYVLTGERATERFRKGYRSGEGAALAVVRPGTLL